MNDDLLNVGDDNTIVSAINFKGHKVKLSEPIELPKKIIRDAQSAAEGIYVPSEVSAFFVSIIEALNNKIKEKKYES